MGATSSSRRHEHFDEFAFDNSDAENCNHSSALRVKNITMHVNFYPGATYYHGQRKLDHSKQPCQALERLLADFNENLLSIDDAEIIERIFNINFSGVTKSITTMSAAELRHANRTRNALSESSNSSGMQGRNVNLNLNKPSRYHSNRQPVVSNFHHYRNARLNSYSGDRIRNRDTSPLRRRSLPKTTRLTPLSRQALVALPTANSMSNKLEILIDQENRCVFCRRFVLQGERRKHFSIFLNKKRNAYNEEFNTVDRGECPICLENIAPGEIIARLPCLCIYHKSCIDGWFEHKKTCPEHPGD